MLAISDVK